MERVRGRILRDDRGVEPELARRIARALVDNLAELHAVDARGVPGRPEGYVGRQVAGWSERWQAARSEDAPTVEAAARWLAAHQPPESGAAVVHGDYKHDNVVLDPGELSRVVAVLDWEMATVGDPLMDLGTMLGYWLDPDDPPELRARAYGPTGLTRRELVERYQERSGRAGFDPLFYYVFALFKLATIVQQIFRRWLAGVTRDERFATLGGRVRALGAQAVRAIERGRIHGLGG
jgi:aminoglycoside phosphotransferase (APT) family kinase protein